jgi:hypothetical protein
MKYEVREEPGKPDFDVKDFRCVSTRGAIVTALLILATVFLVGAAVYGLLHNDFSGLAAVANYLQLPLGMLLAYYFGVQNGQGNYARPDGDASSGI